MTSNSPNINHQHSLNSFKTSLANSTSLFSSSSLFEREIISSISSAISPNFSVKFSKILYKSEGGNWKKIDGSGYDYDLFCNIFRSYGDSIQDDDFL